jgi:hypothetical protein
LKREIPTSKGSAATTQNKDVNTLVNSNKNCLPIYELMQLLTEKNADTAFTVMVNTRNVVDSDYKNDPNLNTALVVSSLPALTDTRSGSDLLSSPLIGKLLNVTSQSDCEKVAFAKDESGAGGEVFTVQKGVNPVRPAVTRPPTIKGRKNVSAPDRSESGAPGRLTLQNLELHETREYRIVNDSLVIDVRQITGGVKACNGKTPEVEVQTRYVMNLSGKDSGLILGPRFAKLLADTLSRISPALATAVKNLTETKAVQKPGQAVPQRPGNATTGIPVTNADLVAMSLRIQNKQFKEIQCK